jgi:hypothetical protein
VSQIRKRLTYANVMSSIAVFLVLGGATAFAASSLGKNTVGSKQLKKEAVASSKIKDGSLQASDFKVGQLPAGPRGPQGPQGATGTVDTSSFYTKTQSDARFLRGTITVVAHHTIAGSTFEEARADCPSGYQAVGGGVDPSNVATMSVTNSSPNIENTPRMSTLPNGNHAAATGWIAWVRNESATAGTIGVAAICSPLG